MIAFGYAFPFLPGLYILDSFCLLTPFIFERNISINRQDCLSFKAVRNDARRSRNALGMFSTWNGLASERTTSNIQLETSPIGGF